MKQVKIKSIEKLPIKYDRYDLTVNSTGNFFANDILIHNTSAIYSRVLCKKSLNWYQKFLKFCGANIPEIDYDYLYASRSVVKNKDMNPDAWIL